MSAWPNLASPRREVSASSHTDQVSCKHVCVLWIVLICVESPHPLCAAPLPMQGILNCVSTENKRSAENHTFILSTLGVDVTTGFKLEPPSYDEL